MVPILQTRNRSPVRPQAQVCAQRRRPPSAQPHAQRSHVPSAASGGIPAGTPRGGAPGSGRWRLPGPLQKVPWGRRDQRWQGGIVEAPGAHGLSMAILTTTGSHGAAAPPASLSSVCVPAGGRKQCSLQETWERPPLFSSELPEDPSSPQQPEPSVCPGSRSMWLHPRPALDDPWSPPAWSPVPTYPRAADAWTRPTGSACRACCREADGSQPPDHPNDPSLKLYRESGFQTGRIGRGRVRRLHAPAGPGVCGLPKSSRGSGKTGGET